MEKLSQDKIQKGLKVLRRDVGSKLLTHVNSCVHCGLCAESCVYYRLKPDEHFVPAKKVDIVSSVYRRYNTLGGKLAPWLTKARKLDDATIEDMVDLLYGSCTMCGRCNKHCSVGVDIEYLVRTGRACWPKWDMCRKHCRKPWIRRYPPGTIWASLPKNL